MTIDKRRRAAAPAGALPTFSPVPRHYNRHDGWTPERQRGFIEALAATGSVRAAAHAVNMTPEGAYMLRRHPEATSFRKAWEKALSLGIERLEDIAMERAINGVEVPVYSYGKLVGTRVVFNDRLLMFLLRNRAPIRFGADGRATARRNSIADPTAATRLSRYKKLWRKEWEAERAAEEDEVTGAEVLDKLDRMLERKRQAWLRDMSPRTRALHDAWQASEAEDKATGYRPPDPYGCGDDPEAAAEYDADLEAERRQAMVRFWGEDGVRRLENGTARGCEGGDGDGVGELEGG